MRYSVKNASHNDHPSSEFVGAHRRVPIRPRANDPNIPAEAAREFHESASLADPAPMLARFPAGSGSHAADRACARSAHGGLPIPDHNQVYRRNNAAEAPDLGRNYR
jgi:hypothetical protein